MPPYIYKEYPRTLHGPGWATCTVRNDDEKAARVAEGWSIQPVGEVAAGAEPAVAAEADLEPAAAPEPVAGDVAPDAPKKRTRKAHA